MACSVTISSYQLPDCFSSRGGIKAVWAAAYVPGGFLLSTGGTVTGFSGVTEWYKQELRRNQGSMTSTLNVNEDNGVSYVSTEAAIVYSKMQKEERMQMNALTKGDFMLVVQDANDSYFALGVEEPCKASSGTGETGTARDDANRYSISMQDYNSEWPPLLDDSAIQALP